jgi:hypothetical protein
MAFRPAYASGTLRILKWHFRFLKGGLGSNRRSIVSAVGARRTVHEPRDRDWSRDEVEATVAGYFEMLSLYLRGEKYSKAAYWRRLKAMLGGRRSEKAVEYKFGNISAVLNEMGFPYIPGCSPYRNYQALLWPVVSEQLAQSPGLVRMVEREISTPPATPEIPNILRSMVKAPDRKDDRSVVRDAPSHGWGARSSPFDFTEQEARNRELGLAGELLVIAFERARLEAVGLSRLSHRVEHVAVTLGPGAGFDVRSFDIDGADRLIEVKTTRYGKEMPFFISRNEIAVSERRADQFHLYRVFDFKHTPRLFDLAGAVSTTCRLDPSQYVARAR